MPAVRNTLPERFTSKIEVQDNGCWIWIASRSQSGEGYGQIRMGGRKGRLMQAHRVIFELLVHPIPDGMEPDHTCENKACVNPDHLELVTHPENVLRAIGWKFPSECVHGHLVESEDDLVVYMSGGVRHRKCRACATANDRRQRERRKRASV